MISKYSYNPVDFSLHLIDKQFDYLLTSRTDLNELSELTELNTKEYLKDKAPILNFPNDIEYLDFINLENWNLHRKLHQNYSNKLFDILNFKKKSSDILNSNKQIDEINFFLNSTSTILYDKLVKLFREKINLFEILNEITKFFLQDNNMNEGYIFYNYIVQTIGGIINHSFFWKNLCGDIPKSQNYELKIDKNIYFDEIYKNLSTILKSTFFSSNWLYYIMLEIDGEIKNGLLFAPDQYTIFNSILNTKSLKGEIKIIFSIDLWEHAFQSTFGTDRYNYVLSMLRHYFYNLENDFIVRRINECYNYFLNKKNN